jgi:hypothetical protein
VGTGLVGLHIVDDTLLQPEPGTSAAEHLVGCLVPLTALLIAALGYRRLGPRGRALLTLALGVLGIIVGTEGWYYAVTVGPARDDYTGLAAGVAGAVLVATAAATAWTSRRRDGSRLRRYARRTLVAVLGAVVLLQVAYPLGVAYVSTHVAYAATPVAEPGLAVEELELRMPDGVLLRAWYVPSRNRAAVITYPRRTAAQPHARFLARHGYGVLLLERRGQGGSEGDPNAYGWGEHEDVAAAAAYLAGRPDVDPGRIGGIGFSVGGEVMLETAAHSPRLSAVVAEGAGFRSIRELGPLARSHWPTYPLVTSATIGTAVFAGELPPPDLADVVRRIGPRPVLLIQAEQGVGGEELAPVYRTATGPTAELWQVPGSTHIHGLQAQPQEYEQRVVSFFDTALLRPDRPSAGHATN